MLTTTTTTFPAELVTRVVVLAAVQSQTPVIQEPSREQNLNRSVAADIDGWMNEMNDFDRF